MNVETNLIHIVETDVFGVKAYHADCQSCEWTTKRFNREATAVEHAKVHARSHVMTCGYCERPIAGEPVEILDAMPGEPTLACQPCHAHYRLGAPADPGPGTPCPYCDEASFVDEGGACIHCGVLRVETAR